MNLIIHDLSKEEWERVASDYEGWEVISDNGYIKPCVGCFGCWIKTPGECVIKDGYERMGALIHKADEIVIMSRYTYGGFSSFIKNVLDRSIGWVLPFFEIYHGEMHHKKRYPEDKPITFMFRGHGLTPENKENTLRYVNAVCTNFHATLKDVIFNEVEEVKDDIVRKDIATKETHDKILLLNCSLRGDNANSKKFLERLGLMMTDEKERINLVSYLQNKDELLRILRSSNKVVLGMPLYVDGIPSAPLRIMEDMEQIAASYPSTGKKIYLVANMGFYESSQLVNLLGMIRSWCDSCGFDYSGGIAIGAGEMLGSMMSSRSIEKGPASELAGALGRLSAAVDEGSSIEDIYVGARGFSRGLYMFAANFGWPRGGRKNGLKKKDLYRCL